MSVFSTIGRPIGHRIAQPIGGAGTGLVPPAGFVFLVEIEGATTYYLIDDDGYFLVEAI